MYSLAGYGSMSADRVRMDAYYDALQLSIQPSSTVVDLGAGPALMSCLAAQMGAAKIYAIDPSDSLEIGKEIARANGLESKIEFHRALSEAVELPERVDVLVSDLRGVLPAFGSHFHAIADARERFLKPGGTLIPQRDTLWLALAEAPDKYGDIVNGWNFDHLDLSIGRRMVANTWAKSHLKPELLLSSPVQWAAVDYRTVTESALAGRLRTRVTRAGVVHGLSVWFDAELLANVGFSNAPGQPETIYGQAFFPLLEPVAVASGDVADVHIRADLTGEDYTWSWNTSIHSVDGALKAEYRQSTFFGLPLATGNPRKRADVFVPVLGPEGRMDQAILQMFGGGQNLRQIAEEAMTRFPGHFADWRAAFDRVAALSVRYSD